MSGASDRAYQWIRSGILDGSLEPGRRLKEEELAFLIGVSRTPIREAVRRLLNDGMAERLPGASAIAVAAFPTPNPCDCSCGASRGISREEKAPRSII